MLTTLHPRLMKAVISFVGLCVFSHHAAVTEGKVGIRAILPAVMNRELPADPTTARTFAITGPASGVHVVEDHAALILFTGEYISETNWKPVSLSDGRKYVMLNHDHVTFEVVGDNPDTSRTVLRMPKLAIGDHARYGLKPEYLPPDFRGAAAVVDLPRGTVSGCAVNDGPVVTTVSLNNDGVLKINAGNKQLVLPGNTAVFIENVPLSFVTGTYQPPSAPFDASHWTAYQNMLRPPTPSKGAISVKPVMDVDSVDPCPPPVSHPEMLMTSACSNSQWP